MTEIRTRFGAAFQVDRDYMGAIGEDVELKVRDSGLYLDPITLSPDEADSLADALKHHAAEVREINRLADERDARA